MGYWVGFLIGGEQVKQLPDKRLARPGRLPSDIDGDMPQAEYEALCKQKQAKGVNCMDIEVVRKAAERIRKRQYDESNDGYEEFLNDEKAVVLWAIEELARRHVEAEERSRPITDGWDGFSSDYGEDGREWVTWIDGIGDVKIPIELRTKGQFDDLMLLLKGDVNRCAG